MHLQKFSDEKKVYLHNSTHPKIFRPVTLGPKRYFIKKSNVHSLLIRVNTACFIFLYVRKLNPCPAESLKLGYEMTVFRNAASTALINHFLHEYSC